MQKGLDGTPEVLLDPNTFSADGTVRLASFKPSRDGKYAAYTQTAIPGSDWVEVHVIDLRTKKLLPEVLRWVKFSGTAWRGDGFFYSRYPEPAKGSELTVRAVNQKIYFHRVGTEQSADALVFEDPAYPERFNGISTTDDERFTIRSANEPGKRGNALWVRDESRPGAGFKPLVGEIGDDRFAVIDNIGGELLVQTTRGAPNGRVMRVDPDKPAAADWSVVLPERANLLQGTSAAGGKLFALYLKDVVSEVEVHGLDGTLENRVELPGPGSAGGFDGDAGAREVFYTYVSMNQPPSIFRYDIATRKTTLFRSPEIPGFDATRFESRQVFYKSKDGTRVPMFLVYRKGLKLDGSNPTILYGYGGFNISLNPSFSAARIAWLEQGGVFALANLRGGGEYGEAWHEAGMRLKKQTVFDDCIAAAEYLIAEGWTPARPAGPAGRQQRRHAGRRGDQPAARAVQGGTATGGRDGHAALPALFGR